MVVKKSGPTLPDASHKRALNNKRPPEITPSESPPVDDAKSGVISEASDLSKSLKSARRIAKQAEQDLKKEVQRYKSAVKKAAEAPGFRLVLDDREKIKRAEWTIESLRHFLKDAERKHTKAVAPSASYFDQVAQSIDEVKAARRRLTGSGKKRNSSTVASPEVNAVPHLIPETDRLDTSSDRAAVTHAPTRSPTRETGGGPHGQARTQAAKPRLDSTPTPSRRSRPANQPHK